MKFCLLLILTLLRNEIYSQCVTPVINNDNIVNSSGISGNVSINECLCLQNGTSDNWNCRNCNVNLTIDNYIISIGNCNWTVIGGVIQNSMPVSLLKFKGKYNVYKDLMFLTWITLSETNNNYFILEKSTNCIDYVILSTIKGNDNTNYKIEYLYSDTSLISDIYYYKLGQIDYDGRYNYLDVIGVKVYKKYKEYYKTYNSLGQQIK